jgi:hypothetical protein
VTGYNLVVDGSEVRFEAGAHPATYLIGNWRPFTGDTVAGACSCRLALPTATSPYVLITCREALPVVVVFVFVCFKSGVRQSLGSSTAPRGRFNQLRMTDV